MSSTVHDTLAPSALTGGRAEAALAGQTLAGRYDILELVGVGGMGAVYRARDRELDEVVALKVIRRELAALPAMVERFRHEVKLARRVTHVNVARTFELGTSDGVMFCTMELVEGESLARRLAQRGALPVGEAVAIACNVCDALAAAHAAGVIHRDIKPDNVLLAHDGRVVVADFGVAAIGVDAAGELAGTPAYMAPEQARGEPATAASDVYSVGVMLFEMLTGHMPFTGTLAEVLAAKQAAERLVPSSRDIPVALAAVIGDATATSAGVRTQTSRSLRHALESWATPLLRTSQPMRAVPAAGEVATVVVLAPSTDHAHPLRYLANAVHEGVLARLTKRTKLRVLPRVGALTEDATFGVCFDVQDKLRVTITHDHGPATELSFPLAVDHVEPAADAIAAAIDSAILRAAERDEHALAALDLLLQARDIAYRDFTRVPEAIERLERAHELAPQEPRIAATLAVGYVRAGFFVPGMYPDGFKRARTLATTSVTLAPDLADAHIACGHLELTTGNPERAASHFRIAIARAPHLAEAHEQLGRMLLEAGYIDAALARLNEALAISPSLRSANWEIARAAALDARWDENERIIRALTSQGLDRPLSRARYAWWRQDWDTVASLRDKISNLDRVLWPGVVDALFEVFLEKKRWSDWQEELFRVVQRDIDNRRRRVFIAQLSCEAAAFSGASDAVVSMLEYAANDGLFDLHWLDKCVMLAPYRELPGFVAVRARIADRAHAILDALYGDHAAHAALSETQVA